MTSSRKSEGLSPFEAQHELLVVPPEGIGGVNLHSGETVPNGEVLVHQALPLLR